MKKGFTLMEMIVTMLLIGIVITISIPAVRNLTYNSGSKKYNQMEKVIVEASKLYAASYQGELTNTSYECFNIPYSTLVKEELVEEEDITCSGQIILRKREKVGYNYEPYLTCTDSKKKVVHEEKRPSSLVNCIGFSGNFKVEYALYNDEGYSNSYTIGNWEKYVYGKYSSVSPYGSGIEKYQYTKDLLNWIDMTGDTEDYTNFNGTIYIRAIDQDGNISSVAHHLIRTDTTGPSYALTNNEHQITNNNTMTVSISNVKDSGVGVEESGNIYSFDGGTTWVNSKSQEFALATTGEVQVKDKLANVTTQPLSVIKACSGNQGASATADKILTGYSAWVNGTLINGSMANNGAVNKTLNPGESYTIPAGFHNGSGKVTVSSLASNTSATATAGQILTGQTAWVNGSKITGTMANRGTLNWAPTTSTTYTVPAGYYSGGTLDSSGAYNAGLEEGKSKGSINILKAMYNSETQNTTYNGVSTMCSCDTSSWTASCSNSVSGYIPIMYEKDGSYYLLNTISGDVRANGRAQADASSGTGSATINFYTYDSTTKTSIASIGSFSKSENASTAYGAWGNPNNYSIPLFEKSIAANADTIYYTGSVSGYTCAGTHQPSYAGGTGGGYISTITATYIKLTL